MPTRRTPVALSREEYIMLAKWRGFTEAERSAVWNHLAQRFDAGLTQFEIAAVLLDKLGEDA